VYEDLVVALNESADKIEQAETALGPGPAETRDDALHAFGCELEGARVVDTVTFSDEFESGEEHLCD